ncbi:RES domain-containing protein [Acinetobacter bereziniae]|uniref:HEPN-associated N-terminal domain-containing protein n=1 Tax=Acinetobacter bereziniae TaxID=106648 RepID=UPI002812DB97|nr:HEPN-associated N-terminal domain-containing protein [Acinetobacter bereziniae]MDQ9820893.1 RES domain-containing protein [Acinetobacter bereziniae]
MGHFSDKAIEQNEKKYHSELDKTICVDCIKDKYLSKLVLENSISNRCSYCEKKFKSNKATTFNFIMDEIYKTIFKYYGDAQDLNLPYENGSWIKDAIPIEDILFEINPGWCDSFFNNLAESSDPFLHLIKHSNNDWLEIPEHVALIYSWDSFKDQILYKTRYLFLNDTIDEFEDRQIIPASLMLNALADLCKEFKLIKKIKKNKLFYRVRSHAQDESFFEFNQMGVAPKKIASAGRMNPVGIPYFYIADSAQTAISEVIKDQNFWSCATFKLNKDIEVIDFSKLPEVPSIFDVNNFRNRQKLIFLHELVFDMSQPVGPDEKDHIEYIPTQVVSEYFRYIFKPEVKGIKYKSVKNQKGLNIAFFESDNEKIKEFFELLSIERN